MIDFRTWISQIVGYCFLLLDKLQMRRAWVEKDYSRTSVTDFDELYEQVFGDLDSDRFEQELVLHLPKDAAAREALTAFLVALRHVDEIRDHDAGYKNPRKLLKSDVWHDLKAAAFRVTSLLGAVAGPDKSIQRQTTRK